MDGDGPDARVLAAVTRRGRRLFTIAELVDEDVGLTYKQIAYRVDTKRWQRVHPKVILTGTGKLTRDEQVWAGVLAAGEGAEASRLCAIFLYGLGDYSKGIDVAVPHKRVVDLEGVTVHRRRRKGRKVTRRKIPVTPIEITLVDVVPLLATRDLHRCFTRAWRKGLTTPRAMGRHLDRHSGHGIRGIAKLRRVISLYDGQSRPPGSDYEADLLFLLEPALKKAGIEMPVLQSNVKIFDGRAEAVIDLAWPARRKALEVVGLDTHGDYVASDYDHERAAEVRKLKWDLLEIAPKAIDDRPAATVRRIVAWLLDA